ncbi:ZP domain-containing protein [Caerostris darwini]|uniref:ZP domain-containing protein n=1 Tax=Caerostris darwini TaxID=1538125 RepID=A0AAV4MAN3_9ARAC|nr:ZP domain-containing protein [Caerostris darwini]
MRWTFLLPFYQVTYDVTCSAKMMKVIIMAGTNQSNIFVENLRGFTGCLPKTVAGKSVIKLPLDNFHECGTTRMTNKYTGQTVYYNRIIIDQPKKPREVLLVKCVLPGDKTKPAEWEKRPKRNVLPPGFFEAEDLNITNIVAHAPTPYLHLAVRQNGRVLDTAYNVQPGTPLEMVIYLDSKSASTYGLLASYLKVTDGTPEHDEIIVMNGCSIDPYIFGNFETPDAGKTLYSKFRAFKFPDSNYVLFVGTVNVCLKQCRGVQCGSDQVGFGRKKREIPAEMPFDPNKLFEVEMTTVLKVQFAPNHFQPKRGSVEGSFDEIQTNEEIAYRQRSAATPVCSFHPFALLLASLLLILAFRH